MHTVLYAAAACCPSVTNCNVETELQLLTLKRSVNDNGIQYKGTVRSFDRRDLDLPCIHKKTALLIPSLPECQEEFCFVA